MLMRENVRSLSLYLILMGVLGLLVSSAAILASSAGLLVRAIAAISFALSLSFIYFGARLRHTLTRWPDAVVTALMINAGMIVLGALGSLAHGRWGAMGGSTIGLIMSWYLITNLQRITEELGPERSNS